LEAFEPRLKEARADRSTIEYYFTCTPCLPLHVLLSNAHVESVIYLDADLYFFSDPTPLLERLRSASMLICPHRFPPHLAHFQKFGIYNVGLVGFRNDTNGLECLKWWRDRCLEWCYDRPEGARFADQRYLDEWPERFSGVLVASDSGVNLAPWNVGAAVVRVVDGQPKVNGEPLVFYHFHGIRTPSRHVFELGLHRYQVKMGPNLLHAIYAPYLQQLQASANGKFDPQPNLRAQSDDPGPRVLMVDNVVAELVEAAPETNARATLAPLSRDDPAPLLALSTLAQQRQSQIEELELRLSRCTMELGAYHDAVGPLQDAGGERRVDPGVRRSTALLCRSFWRRLRATFTQDHGK
jgi:hypothetical protein